MDTHIVRNKDGKNYNTFNEEVIECEICSAPTTMTGTKLCDGCWNAKGIFNTKEKEILIDSLNTFCGGLRIEDDVRIKIKKLIKKVKLL